jgi:MFS superfamily sulfate permease-like transporter
MSSTSTSVLSSFFASPHFLRRVLWADAASGVATGAVLFAFADALAPLLGLPAELLLWSSYILVGFVLLISWAATRRTIPAGAVWVLIGCNALWVMGCVALLLSSQIVPTGFGVAFLVVNAVTVGVFLELEWIGVRKLQLAHAW